MLKLFAVMLGGRSDGCNVELHDVVFAIGRSLEETYPSLINKWFGNKKRLHIDSTIELTYVDNHEIFISKDKPKQDKKIFFVNFGAYKPDHFGEIHETAFYIASSKSEVLERAKQDLCVSLLEPHCDDNLDIDDIIAVDCVDDYYVHLKQTSESSKLFVESYYRRLDLPVSKKTLL